MRRLGIVLGLLACAACGGPAYYGPRPSLIPPPTPYDGPPPAAADARSFAGCYRASYRASRDRTDAGWSFVLNSVAPTADRPGSGKETPGVRRARTFDHGHRSEGYWRPIPNGFQIYLGDTLHGVYYDFVGHGDAFHGRAFWHSDVTFDYVRVRVAARRVPCAPDGALPASAGRSESPSPPGR